MMHNNKMSLKAFWEAVEQRLAACSADELRSILRAMARETSPSARRDFLFKLEPVDETAVVEAQDVHRCCVEHRAQQERFLPWCLDAAHKRVDAIVGNQYRGSYDKAAVLAVACAETLRSRGDQTAADALVSDVRGRFPRHSAFQREMRAAIARM